VCVCASDLAGKKRIRLFLIVSGHPLFLVVTRNSLRHPAVMVTRLGE